MEATRRGAVEQVAMRMFSVLYFMSRGQRRAMDPTRLAILQNTAMEGVVRPSEIAANLGVHQSAVTRQTRTLEDAGLVDIVADPKDRRSCLIKLTEDGMAEVRRLTGVGVDIFDELLDGWSAEELRTFSALLGRLLEAGEAQAQRNRPRGPRWRTEDSAARTSQDDAAPPRAAARDGRETAP